MIGRCRSGLFSALTAVAGRPRLLWRVLLANVVACGLFYSLIEDKGPIEGVWWAIVTGSTVGYGDFYPQSTAGRAIGAYLIVSMFLLALCAGAHLTARLIPVPPDPHLFTDAEQRYLLAAMVRLDLRTGTLPPEYELAPEVQELVTTERKRQAATAGR